MAHIHTEPGQHDHTISIYLFRTDFAEPKILLHFHRKIGGYAQFGGHIELHETPWQAAAHELEEESGYSIKEVAILQPTMRLHHMSTTILHPQTFAQTTVKYPGSTGHSHIDNMYAVTTLKDPKGAPAEDESKDLKLFTRDEIATMEEIDPMTREAALYAFDFVLKEWQPVSTSEFKL